MATDEANALHELNPSRIVPHPMYSTRLSSASRQHSIEPVSELYEDKL